MAPERRKALLERARKMTSGNLRIVSDWLDAHECGLSWVPPEAGAMAFIRYRHDIGSTALATRLREAEEMLIVPGDHFGLDGYLRVGLAGSADLLREGLVRLDPVLASLPQRMRRPTTDPWTPFR